MTKPLGPYPLCEVEWVDSTGADGWHDPDTANELLGKIECRCAGYLISDEPAGIIIALGIGGLGQLLNSMAIPRRAITDIRHLKS